MDLPGAVEAAVMEKDVAEMDKGLDTLVGPRGLRLSGGQIQRAAAARMFVCYLRDEERSGRQELYDQIGALAPLLCRLWIYDLNALYLFENGVRLDMDFCRPSDVHQASRRLTTQTRILHDPDAVLARSLALSDEPQTAPHPQWFESGDQAMIDWFFWILRQIVCWAKRGAQGGYRAFDKLANAEDSIRQARTRLVEMRLWTLGVNEHLGKIDPACARRIAQIYPHLEPGELVVCARRLLDEFEHIVPAYCAKSGAAYPAHKVSVMRSLIDEFERLE